MSRSQSTPENYLNQFLRKTEKMQLISRNVYWNLTKNTHITQTAAKVIRGSFTGLDQEEQRHGAVSHNYSTAPKGRLLRFPAFPLNETIARFIKTTEPLLSDDELEQTKAATEKFLQCEGAELQKLLEKVAEKEENWLAGRWLRTAYLQYRDPVTVYSSPGMAFPLQRFANDDEYLLYAGKVIYNLLKYKEIIDCDQLPKVKMGKLELDNSQFHVVFGTCRIPKPQEDRMEYHSRSYHIVVIYKNHFYKLPVYDEHHQPLHPTVYVDALYSIMRAEKKKSVPIGILTTDHRDNWACAYEKLIENQCNESSIKEIQQSLFTLSLDETVPANECDQLNVFAAQLIHGGGHAQNSGNRWMDKTIQVIINRNGMSGFCYEHSPAEGQAIALMTDYIYKNLKNDKHYDGSGTTKITANKLPIEEVSTVDDYLEKAINNVDNLAKDLQNHVLHYKGYGKGFLKQQKLSPDSYIQMAIQLAFYKLHKVPGAQYESAHLRVYTGGRTETIRSCSNESLAFARAMCDHDVTDQQRVECLRQAVNSHREYTSLALQGRGVDRHLLGLKLMAIENNLPIPEFYKSPGYVKSSHFRLSTSQVASVIEAFMCYGPLTHDGYACCYNPRESDIFLALAAWRSNKDTDAVSFGAALSESFDDMARVLCAVNKVNSKL